jgi:hypothetical protein
MQRMTVIGACLLALTLIGSPSVMGRQMPMGSQGEQELSAMGRGMMCPMTGGMMVGQIDPSGMMGMMGMMGG